MGDPLSTVFDVAILGTGLVESIVAAAAARAGRTVLHVDAATFYGGADASLPLPQFIEWAGGESGEHGEAAHDTPNGHSAEWASVRIQPLVQPSDVAPPPLPVAVAALARRFTIDFRPRLVLSRGAVVDLLVLSGVSQHVDFKAADAAYYVDAVAPRRLEVSKVPANKGDVFSHPRLSLLEKHRLMRFMQFALDQLHADSVAVPDVSALNEAALGTGRSLLRPQNKSNSRIDLEAHRSTPFGRFLAEQCDLSPGLVRMLTHAVAMVPADVGDSEGQPASAGRGVARLRQYLGAMGRFGATPFIAPLYGHGELAQAFCRSCAVHGGVYMLRTAPAAWAWESDGSGGEARGDVVAVPALATVEPAVAPTAVEDGLVPPAVSVATAEAATSAAGAPRSVGVPPSSPPYYAIRLVGGDVLRARRVLAGPGYVGGPLAAVHAQAQSPPRPSAVVGCAVLITDRPVKALLRAAGATGVAPDDAGTGGIEAFTVAPGTLPRCPPSPVLIVQLGAAAHACPDGFYVVHVRMAADGSGDADVDAAATRRAAVDAVTRCVSALLAAGDATTSAAPAGVLWSYAFSATAGEDARSADAAFAPTCGASDACDGAGAWVRVPGDADSGAAAHDDDAAVVAEQLFRRLFPLADYFPPPSPPPAPLLTTTQPLPDGGSHTADTSDAAARAGERAITGGAGGEGESAASGGSLATVAPLISAPTTELRDDDAATARNTPPVGDAAVVADGGDAVDVAEALAMLRDADF